MGISKQHFHILVTRDKSHFRHGQPHFKKPADGFMTKVMETKVVYTSTASKASPRQPEGVSVDREGCVSVLGCWRQSGFGWEWHLSTTSVLRQRQEGYGGSSRYCPTTTRYFPAPRPVLRQSNNWPNVLVPCQFGCLFQSLISPSSKRLFLGLGEAALDWSTGLRQHQPPLTNRYLETIGEYAGRQRCG